MAKHASVDVVISGFGKSYRSSNDFLRDESSKSTSSIIKDEFYTMAADQLNINLNKKLTPKQKSAIVARAAKIKQENPRREIRKMIVGEQKKLRMNNVVSSENKPPESYNVAAKIFQRIIARTPYDEDYDYYITYGNPFAKNSSSSYEGKGWEINHVHTVVRHHTKDDDVVKNEWIMEVKGISGKKCTVSRMTFEAVNFESIMDEADWKVISSYVYHQLQEDMKSVLIWNTNPRTGELEYGKYEKHTLDKYDRIPEGPNRYHATYNGYSVQAPRGFVALTMKEFKDTEIKAKDEETGHIVGYSASSLSFDFKFNMDALMSKLTEHMKKEFNEKDILDLLIKKKNAIELNHNETIEHAMDQEIKDSIQKLISTSRAWNTRAEDAERLEKEAKALSKERGYNWDIQTIKGYVFINMKKLLNKERNQRTKDNKSKGGVKKSYEADNSGILDIKVEASGGVNEEITLRDLRGKNSNDEDFKDLVDNFYDEFGIEDGEVLYGIFVDPKGNERLSKIDHDKFYYTTSISAKDAETKKRYNGVEMPFYKYAEAHNDIEWKEVNLKNISKDNNVASIIESLFAKDGDISIFRDI